MLMYARIAIAALVGAGFVAPALAHHSAAMFDADKEITLNGTLREFQYTNPHSWIQLVVTGAEGKPTEWSIETAAPIVLLRAGIKKNAFEPGEKLAVRVHPMKDGSTGGSLIEAKKADGTVVSLRGPGN
jgi:hypothetical protein